MGTAAIVASLLTGFLVGVVILVLSFWLLRRYRRKQTELREQRETVELQPGKESATYAVRSSLLPAAAIHGRALRPGGRCSHSVPSPCHPFLCYTRSKR